MSNRLSSEQLKEIVELAKQHGHVKRLSDGDLYPDISEEGAMYLMKAAPAASDLAAEVIELRAEVAALRADQATLRNCLREIVQGSYGKLDYCGHSTAKLLAEHDDYATTWREAGIEVLKEALDGATATNARLAVALRRICDRRMWSDNNPNGDVRWTGESRDGNLIETEHPIDIGEAALQPAPDAQQGESK